MKIPSMKTPLVSIRVHLLHLWWILLGFRNLGKSKPGLQNGDSELSPVIQILYFTRGRIYKCKARFNVKTRWPRLVDNKSHQVIGSLEPTGIQLSEFYWKPMQGQL